MLYYKLKEMEECNELNEVVHSRAQIHLDFVKVLWGNVKEELYFISPQKISTKLIWDKDRAQTTL